MNKLSLGETSGATKASPRVLGELAVENCQNFGATAVATPQSTHGLPFSGSGKDAAHLVNPEPKFIKAQIDQQPLRHHRPALQPQTFEPLDTASQHGGKVSNNMAHIKADDGNEDSSNSGKQYSLLSQLRRNLRRTWAMSHPMVPW